MSTVEKEVPADAMKPARSKRAMTKLTKHQKYIDTKSECHQEKRKRKQRQEETHVWGEEHPEETEGMLSFYQDRKRLKQSTMNSSDGNGNGNAFRSRKRDRSHELPSPAKKTLRLEREHHTSADGLEHSKYLSKSHIRMDPEKLQQRAEELNATVAALAESYVKLVLKPLVVRGQPAHDESVRSNYSNSLHNSTLKNVKRFRKQQIVGQNLPQRAVQLKNYSQ